MIKQCMEIFEHEKRIKKLEKEVLYFLENTSIPLRTRWEIFEKLNTRLCKSYSDTNDYFSVFGSETSDLYHHLLHELRYLAEYEYGDGPYIHRWIVYTDVIAKNDLPEDQVNVWKELVLKHPGYVYVDMSD